MQIISKVTHWLKALTIVWAIVGLVTFSMFIFEEGIQMATFACWSYERAKDWEGAEDCLRVYNKVLGAGRAYIHYIGWINPLAWRAYCNFILASESFGKGFQSRLEAGDTSYRRYSRGYSKQPLKANINLTCKEGSIYLLKNEEYFHVLRDKIKGAKEEIHIATFIFKTDDSGSNWAREIMDDLVDAKKRGIKVYVLLDRQDPNSPFFDKDFASINELTSRHLAQTGISVKMDSPYKTTHSKVIVIDRHIILMGSHNLTSSAFRYNNELSVMIDSASFARDVLNYLDKIEGESPSKPRWFGKQRFD